MAGTVEPLTFASEPRAIFYTVHAKEQDVGEIDPKFFRDCKNEAAAYWWRLYDKDGLRLKVRLDYNYEDGVPRRTEGWNFLQQHYNWEDDVKILFKWYGRSHFQIIPMGTVTPTQFPSWHSLSLNIKNADTFVVKNTKDPNIVPELDLPEDLAWYLQQKGLSFLCSVGENREKYKCKLTYDRNEWPNPEKIYRGWPEVCGINGFKVGDTIKFKIKNIYDNHSVYMFKM